MMAPEIYESAPYDLKCDIWSLGCITYEFLFQTFPYVINEKGYNAQQEIIRLREKMKKENYSFPKNVAVSDECKHFISRCLLKDPTKRASAN